MLEWLLTVMIGAVVLLFLVGWLGAILPLFLMPFENIKKYWDDGDLGAVFINIVLLLLMLFIAKTCVIEHFL